MLTHSLLPFLAVVNSFPLSVQGAHTSVLVSVHTCFLRGCWINGMLLLGIGSPGSPSSSASFGARNALLFGFQQFVTKDNKYRSSIPYHRVWFKF